ncbi:hypothetical protein K431DRAFT_284208 [Polychaeton citri CBS 116435]|uniref:Uncharacterized protein n=1 Tax=Polychaeton citri CBS 116435 TaxID=1314669 RepID=A0A9P4QC58_9PEZI|nr:hypothetical protein K431DRAFT_284208 [Polychaeton citri CBS 116435]
MSAFRAYGRQPGMQVHAVPEGERAFDTAGRRLPWGYERSDRAFHPNSAGNKDASSSSSSQQNGAAATAGSDNTERGPFGKSTRRRRGTSRSRSKTAEMLGKRGETEEERVLAENAAREDVVFGKLARRVEGGAEGGKEDVEGGGTGAAGAGSARLPASAMEDPGEPTEVLLWGFGREMQWAAIDFYERASSGGSVLEDYDRAAPGQRYVNPAANRSLGRAGVGSLSRAALRKKNQFAGGEHWIKVTFDSRQAADVACARSPHVVHGFVVSAEPWRGVGPARDEEVIASGTAGSYDSPGSSSRTMLGTRGVIGGSPGPQSSSQTVTSATVTDTGIEDDVDSTLRPLLPASTPVRSGIGGFYSQPPQQGLQPSSSSTTLTHPASSSSTQLQFHTQAQQQPPTIRSRGRIQGLTIAQPLPAEAALMPRKPISPASATNTLLGWILWLITLQWITALFGGSSGSAGSDGWIGSAVPKRDEDGTFDWERAGWYWRMWAQVDRSMGSDFCGLRGD